MIGAGSSALSSVVADAGDGGPRGAGESGMGRSTAKRLGDGSASAAAAPPRGGDAGGAAAFSAYGLGAHSSASSFATMCLSAMST